MPSAWLDRHHCADQVAQVLDLLVTVHFCLQTDNRAFATADDESDDEPAPPPSKAAAPGRPSAAAGRGAGRGGTAAAGGKGPKDAATRQAELRQKKLQEEAEVRLGQLVQKGGVTDGCEAGSVRQSSHQLGQLLSKEAGQLRLIKLQEEAEAKQCSALAWAGA
jgi:hypothetical protein